MADAGVPTELAGVADANTAGGARVGVRRGPRSPNRARFGRGGSPRLVVGAAVVVIAAASGNCGVVPRVTVSRRRGPASRPDSLNRVYRVEYHWDQATYREAEGNTNWGESADAGPAQ